MKCDCTAYCMMVQNFTARQLTAARLALRDCHMVIFTANVLLQLLPNKKFSSPLQSP